MKSISIIKTKHILLCLLIVISNLKPIRLHSQNEAAMAIGGAVAVAGLAALAIELSVEDYKAQLLHNAAEYIMADTFGEKVLIGSWTFTCQMSKKKPRCFLLQYLILKF